MGSALENENIKSYSKLSDSQLADLVQKGDDNAFEEITNRYKGLNSYLAYEYCIPEYDVCDFTQEGLLGLLSACKTYDTNAGTTFKNYVATCIKNRFVSIIRKSKSKGAIPKENIVSIDDKRFSDIEDFEFSDNNKLNPEELVVSKERLEDFLIQMKQSLSQMEITVAYFYLKGLTYQEISQKTGLSKKSVDNALQRVKKKLQE